MTHEELKDRLLDLVYDELPPADAREVEAHAAGCEECRGELARMRGTRKLMSALPEEPAPERGEALLVAAAREEARVRPPRRRWSVLLEGAALAATVAAVGMVSWRLLSSRPSSPLDEDRGALEARSRYAEPPPLSAAAPQAAPAPGAPSPPAAAREQRLAAAPEADRQERRMKDEPEGARRIPPPAARGEVGRGEAAPVQDHAAADAAPRPAPEAEAPPAPMAEALSAPPPPAPTGRAAAKAMSRAAPAAAPDPVARHQALRGAGRLRADFRMAPGCAVEAWRRVERDPEGRIVAYAWDEERGGRRVIFEVIYGLDGAVAARRAYDADTKAPVPGDFAAPPASAVDLDAPARCSR